MTFLQRFKNLNFWNKLAAVGSVVSIVAFIISFLTPKPPEIKIESKNQVGGIVAQNVVVNNYFERPATQEKIRKEKLTQEYPLGYAIFTADGKNIEIPNGLSFENEFEMRWGNAKVYDLTPNSISINLPDMMYRPSHSSLINVGMIIPRKIGQKERVPVKFFDQEIVPIVEVLDDQGTFVVFVLGFRRG
jgi:hypothetical protein